MKKNKLSKEPYKGTRDFYPEDMAAQNYIFSAMRRVVENYGYQEYNASLLEETDLYRAKSGEEIINEQTYSFKDRGGRDVTIRPEMTPTAARMVARRRKELVFPLRWYSIPNMWRYEKPQRGRLREHWQLNVDIFGVQNIKAEIEMIKIAYDIMRAFGVDEKKFIVKINNRRLMNYFYEYLGLDEYKSYKLSKLIDRKLKIGEKEFKAQAEEITGDASLFRIIEKFLGAKKVEEVEDIIKIADKAKKQEEQETKKLENMIICKDEKRYQKEGNKDEIRGVNEINDVINSLKKAGIKNVVFDPTLMRGFDYYTGIVFEVFDANPKNMRALFGGGRYDDLVGIFDVEKVSGVGFGMGDVTIRDVLETYNLLPEYRSKTDLYICVLDMEYTNFADELADNLRKQNARVAVDYTNRKLGAQIKTADRQKIPFVICIGEDEIRTGKFKVKNMLTGKEVLAKRDRIAATVIRYSNGTME
ncbi:MAG: histidine--tRNA ligase [bacterium]